MKRYHLIGIGGIGMSGIAQLLLRRGMTVSGSDLKESENTGELKALGARIFLGHDPSNIKNADLVVYSSAIKEDNPEIKEAKKRGLSLIKRAEALADLMQDKIVITVAGSHGKTTVTSLLSYLLLEASFNPTVAIGGILRNIKTNAFLGDGKFFVAEADESDGSFLYYKPKYSIITNIDKEHLDYYKNFASEIDTFGEFIRRTSGQGCVFACYDDINLRDLLRDYKNRYMFFGLDRKADIYAQDILIKGLSSSFDCFCKNKFISRFSLALGGRHNISNALSVIALGLELKIDLRVIKKALIGFKGTRRRLEVKFQDTDYLVIDDYAHHPTEIQATLKAVKDLKPKRVIAIFQPHRYSRTKILLDEFAQSFDLADYLVITDIYAAGEPQEEGISGSLLVEKIKRYSAGKQVRFLPKERIAKHILEIIRSGDLVIVLGAGDIVKISNELAEGLKNKV